MRLAVRSSDGHRDVVVSVDDEDTTIARLADALDLPVGPGIDVDGRFVPADTPLSAAGITDGAVIAAARPHGPAWRRPQPPVWITVVAGPGTGDRAALRPNDTVVVGRAPDCGLVLDSPTVSGRHALITLTGDDLLEIRDVDSRNGTWIDGTSIHAPTVVDVGTVMRLGACAVGLVAPDPDDRPSGHERPTGTAGTTSFNRRPRTAQPRPSDRLDLPTRPQVSAASRGFRAAALIGPIVMGAFLMAMNGGDVRYAGLAVVSPIAMLAMWWSDRRRRARQGRASAATFEQDLARFRLDLARAWRRHRALAELATPPMSEVVRRCTAPSARLWERRLGHPDALQLRVGSADVEWRAPVAARDSHPPAAATAHAVGPGHGGAEDEVAALLAEHATLPTAPATVDLAPSIDGAITVTDASAASGMRGGDPRGGGVVGIVGEGDAPRALARALLVQATTFHGPADLCLAVFASPRHADSWAWTKWLPHTGAPGGQVRLVSGRREVSIDLLQGMLDARLGRPDGTRGPWVGNFESMPFLVVDDVSLLTGRDAPARRLLAGAGGPATGIVVARTLDLLPASCGVVVRLDADSMRATVDWPATGACLDDVLVAGIDTTLATAAARSMARWDDPELALRGGAVPDLVRLLPLLDMADVDQESVTASWKRAGTDPGAPATLGAGADGPVAIDLRVDGPHGLVGGTTGSGKSELLRSMIAGMAARVDPDHLLFVLVDYKGGSAFDLCADLPHTVGMVTDLDEHLGRRALVSLEAELRHRERMLRDTGAQDLTAYLELGSPAGPLPRLVVVIDEFATLATELPDFLASLVGVAQRGRSLGVHLVLATQRPRGVVDANVRANTNLRIAMRVQDPGDSTDIIDVPDAAHLPRDRPGRAWVRRGHGDLVLLQTALSTAGGPDDPSPLRVVPFRFAPTTPLPTRTLSDDSDLARLVAACRRAFTASGADEPRRPWLPLPPRTLDLRTVLDLPHQPRGIVIGLEDVPERQAQLPFAWDPRAGHLGLFGMVGQGTTTALHAVAASIATTRSPDDVHLYGIDFGGGGLRDVATLPHAGAIADGTDVERQARLLTWLQDEVGRRRAMDPDDRTDQPLVVVLVDKVAAFLAEHQGIETRSVAETFDRTVREGPSVGIVMALAGETPRDLPGRLAGRVATTLTFRLAERASVLVGSRAPALVPGRAWDASADHVVQIALPPDMVEAARDLHGPTRHVPDPVATVPASVAASDLAVGPHAGDGPLRVPIGLDAATMTPAVLELHHGDHAAIIGPARSGASTVLQTISAQLRRLLPAAIQLAVCDPLRSPLAGFASLDGHGSVTELREYLDLGKRVAGRWFVFVDDAGRLTGDPIMAGMLAARPDLHVIAAGRTADMRGGYGDWIRDLRAGRTGVLLRPDLPMGGDLLGARLPRRVTTPLTVGRGFVVTGGAHVLAQFATPPDPPPPGGLAA